MVQFNTRANEILLKLVYYGPGLSGKTTNLRALHAMCKEANRGEMFSVNTQEDRTLFFDLLPINLGYIYGNSIHLQVYTVPGQVQYDASRRVVLGGADGVVFVADSSEAKMQEDVDSLSNLYHNLNANRLNIKQIPFVIQYNKRDLPDAMPVGVMNRRLNFRSVPYFESVASRGEGVLETFLAIARETVATTFRKYHLDKKIKDFEEMLRQVESNVRDNMQAAPPPPESQQDSRVVLRQNASVADVALDPAANAQDLLEDALKSNMETARLYTELKAVKESFEKKNDELRQIYAQLERANQDNLKTRRYLEGLIQSVAEAIISFSADGRILTWNAAAEKIFGYPRNEIVGRTFHQFTPPGHEGELDQAIAQVAKGQTIRGVATTRLRKGGAEFPVSITYAPIRGADDRVLAFSALVRDMGTEQRLEQRLQEVESSHGLTRIMPQLFKDVANHLTPILLHKGMVLEGTEAERGVLVAKLLQSVERAEALAQPLLMLLYPAVPRLESCNLNDLVQEVAQGLEAEAAAAKVILELTLDPSLQPCALDPAMMREGLACLLRHGLRQPGNATARRLRVGTRQSGPVQQLVCHDTGHALKEQDPDRLLDFPQAGDVESLGLCVIASVARAHGGRITVRSQEGQGNAFLVELPMADVPAPKPSASLQGQKVLVVDDEAFLLECLVDAIGSWGSQATPCSQGAEAIQKLESGRYDLIVSDIRMPGLNGIQLYDWIRAEQPHMAGRILFTTGDSFDPDTHAFLERVQAPYLGKPFDLKKLKRSLTDLLAANL
jgi:PAS domain S-box-containing protein